MQISLIISTYNNPGALAALLRSVIRQTRPPYEVIVGDDGSGPETLAVIQAAKAAAEFPPVHHVWQEDRGFRVARARNGAIAKSGGEYLVFVDGDVVLHERFMEDHAAMALPDSFIEGGRVYLYEEQTRLALQSEAYWPSLFSKGIGSRKNLIRCRLAAAFFQKRNMATARSCNFAAWRADLVRVNGFNEDFEGWGLEDNELAVRLLNAGCRGRCLRHMALCCHLQHPHHSRETAKKNKELYLLARKEKRTWCDNGLNGHGTISVMRDDANG